jgi:hypothetical protein
MNFDYMFNLKKTDDAVQSRVLPDCILSHLIVYVILTTFILKFLQSWWFSGDPMLTQAIN